MDAIRDVLQEAIRDMSEAELEEMRRQVSIEIEHASQDPKRAVSPGEEGGPRDTAVQQYAAYWLKQEKIDKGKSFAEIGKQADVSRERVRRLFEKLCPAAYASIKQSRREA